MRPVVIGAIAAVAVVVVWLAGLWYFQPWVAHNDFAVFRLRLERVLDGELGTSGAHSRLEVSHPGPAREWSFALPYLLSGRRAAALPATAMVVNLAWVALVIAIAWRHRGRWIGVVAATGAAVVLVAMRDQLDSPWNPHLAILPLFVACVATVLVLDGSRWAWIVAVSAASFAGQMHASALIVSGALFVLVVVGEWRADDGRPWWRSIVLGVVLWIGPVIDLTRGADANIVRLATTDAGVRVGLGGGLEFLSRLTWPPSVVRGVAIEPSVVPLVGSSRWWLFVVTLVLVVGIGVVETRRSAIVALVGLGGAAVSIALFVEPPFRYLFGPLQAVAAFALVMAVVVIAAGARRRRSDASVAAALPPWLGSAAVGLGVVACIVSVAATGRHDHESAARRELALESAIDRHLADHPDWSTVTVIGVGLRAANPVAEVADVLVRRGLDPHSDWPGLDLAAPTAGAPLYVVAMGDAISCLVETGAVPLTEGTVPSVGEPIALFAVAAADVALIAGCGPPAI